MHDESEEPADIVFATPWSWSAVSELLESGLKGDVLRIKTEANVVEALLSEFSLRENHSQ